MFEVAQADMISTAQAAGGALHALVPIAQVVRSLVGRRPVLQVRPQVLDRVELGRVGGQAHQPQPVGLALGELG